MFLTHMFECRKILNGAATDAIVRHIGEQAKYKLACSAKKQLKTDTCKAQKAEIQTLQKQKDDAQMDYKKEIAVATNELEISINDVDVTFESMECASTDIPALVGAMRKALLAYNIVGSSTLPVKTSCGSVVVTVSAASADDKKIIEENMATLVKMVEEDVGAGTTDGPKDNATTEDPAKGENKDDDSDDGGSRMPIIIAGVAGGVLVR